MTALKKCVAIINNRSGHRHSAHAYTDTLKQYMNRAGIVHHDIHIPNDDVAENLRRLLPSAEALILCGGDGTVNSAVNLMAAMTAAPVTASTSSEEYLSSSSIASSSLLRSMLEQTPLLLVPTGLHNSIAVSLGVVSAERAVSSLVIGRSVQVPLWAVHLHTPPSSSSSSSSTTPFSPSPVRYMCSYVAAGTYAFIVRRQEKWKEAQEDYVSLPSLLGTLTATSLYTACEHATPHCAAELTTGSEGGAETTHRRLGPLRMLVAAQLPQLQAGYSLTPTATYHQRRLTVTTATDDATRLRMWHLLRREAREGYVLSEDGVAMHEGVQGLRIDFPRPSATEKVDEKDTGKDAKGDGDAALLVLDGECVRVPQGSTVTVTPTDLTARFIVS